METPPAAKQSAITLQGARMHHLKNLHLQLGRQQLIVITGISGSGKSSLAFDTIYAESQRRYMASLSAYARRFTNPLPRPEIDAIQGLGPSIAIAQKTTGHNARSTVGTTTEIYDLLRLLYARIGTAYAYTTGEKMEEQTLAQLVEGLSKRFTGQTIQLLAPLVRQRKGQHKALLERLATKGFQGAWINGQAHRLQPMPALARYQTHDIDGIVAKVDLSNDTQELPALLAKTLDYGKGVAIVQDAKGQLHYFSQHLMDAKSGLAYDAPAPHSFSFNNKKGACPDCRGIGYCNSLNYKALMPDKTLSIRQGGIVPLGPYRNTFFFKKVTGLLELHKGITLDTPLKDFPTNVIKDLLHGSKEKISLTLSNGKWAGQRFNFTYKGVIHRLQKKLPVTIQTVASCNPKHVLLVKAQDSKKKPFSFV